MYFLQDWVKNKEKTISQDKAFDPKIWQPTGGAAAVCGFTMALWHGTGGVCCTVASEAATKPIKLSTAIPPPTTH